MRSFTIIKMGYSTGIYGLSGEYYKLIYVNYDVQYFNIINFQGMYGADSRIREAMQKKGYNYYDLPNKYGKMNKREADKLFMPEREAMEKIRGIE